ncbi:uncharacterized protein LOC144880304 [Branchiostoma floridae x Branchiostoma japonicum]
MCENLDKVDGNIDQEFDELYRQCERFSKHKKDLHSLKLKKLRKAGKPRVKRLSGSLTSHDQDWSGLSTGASPAACDGWEPEVDSGETWEIGDHDRRNTGQKEEKEVCMEQYSVDSKEEEDEELTLLDDDEGTIDDTSTYRVTRTVSSVHVHRLGHQTLPSKTNRSHRTLKRRLREPPLEYLSQSADGRKSQDNVLPLFCDPTEHLGGVWQSIVVEKDERPCDGMVE